jgi:hypothetical protein
VGELAERGEVIAVERGAAADDADADHSSFSIARVGQIRYILFAAG